MACLEVCNFTTALNGWHMQGHYIVTTAEGVNETCGGVVGGSPYEGVVAMGRIHVGVAGNHFPSWGLDWNRG